MSDKFYQFLSDKSIFLSDKLVSDGRFGVGVDINIIETIHVIVIDTTN